MMIFEDVNRVELIVDGERQYVTWDATEIMMDLQDGNRTLKLFLKTNKVKE